METSRATEKIYTEWNTPSLHQMPWVARIPSQAVRATRRAWHLAPEKGLGSLPLGQMQAALRQACLALWVPDPNACALCITGFVHPQPLPPAWPLKRQGVGHLTGCLPQACWKDLSPPSVVPRPTLSSCPACPFSQTAMLWSSRGRHCPSCSGCLPVNLREAGSSRGVGFALGGPDITLPHLPGLCTSASWFAQQALWRGGGRKVCFPVT